jgi:ketosteroid isomerase-like protein
MSARAVFEEFREHIFERRPEQFWAEDVVVEQPFAAGGPSRIEGRAAFLAKTEASRDSLPVEFEEMRNVVVHDTTDPDKLIVEYELTGTVLTTGKWASARFIAVMEVRDGRMTLWREYQNTLAIAQALGQIPVQDKAF